MVGENLNWSCEELAFVMTLGIKPAQIVYLGEK